MEEVKVSTQDLMTIIGQKEVALIIASNQTMGLKQEVKELKKKIKALEKKQDDE